MGCRFARRVVEADRATVQVFWDLDAHVSEQIDALCVASAMAEQLAIIAFPAVSSAVDIARLVDLFCRLPRWSCDRIDVPRPPDHIALAMWWQTPRGKPASVMGLAPLGCQPRTRRAPYTALVLWPGRRRNPYARGAPGHVGLIDARLPEDMTRERYRSLRSKSTDDTRGVFPRALPHDAYRETTFILPNSVEPGLTCLSA